MAKLRPSSPTDRSTSSGSLVQDARRFRPKFYFLWCWWQLFLLCNRRFAGGYFHLGNAYFAQGLPEQAMHQWQRCVALDQRHVRAWNNLAAVLLQQKRWSEVADVFLQLMKLQPEQPDHSFRRAQCLDAAGHQEEALQVYSEALAVTPDHVEGRYSYAKLLFQSKQLKAAAEQFQQIVSVREDHVGAYEHLGKIYMAYKKYDTAERMFQAALVHAEKPDSLYYILGMVAERRGERETACGYYEQIQDANLVPEASKRIAAMRQEQV